MVFFMLVCFCEIMQGDSPAFSSCQRHIDIFPNCIRVRRCKKVNFHSTSFWSTWGWSAIRLSWMRRKRWWESFEVPKGTPMWLIWNTRVNKWQTCAFPTLFFDILDIICLNTVMGWCNAHFVRSFLWLFEVEMQMLALTFGSKNVKISKPHISLTLGDLLKAPKSSLRSLLMSGKKPWCFLDSRFFIGFLKGNHCQACDQICLENRWSFWDSNRSVPWGM